MRWPTQSQQSADRNDGRDWSRASDTTLRALLSLADALGISHRAAAVHIPRARASQLFGAVLQSVPRANARSQSEPEPEPADEPADVGEWLNAALAASTDDVASASLRTIAAALGVMVPADVTAAAPDNEPVSALRRTRSPQCADSGLDEIAPQRAGEGRISDSSDAPALPEPASRTNKRAPVAMTWDELHERASRQIPLAERREIEQEINRRTSLSRENAPPLPADEIRTMVRRGERFEFCWDSAQWVVVE